MKTQSEAGSDVERQTQVESEIEKMEAYLNKLKARLSVLINSRMASVLKQPLEPPNTEASDPNQLVPLAGWLSGCNDLIKSMIIMIQDCESRLEL